MKNDKNQKNSLIMYTSLIFIVAIVIVILAFLAQKHSEKSKPLPTTAEIVTSSPEVTDNPSAVPQGIAKTAAELSQENLELLEENRDLLKKTDELKEENNAYKKLIEAYTAMEADDSDRAKALISDIDYESLTQAAKTLYDLINIQ